MDDTVLYTEETKQIRLKWDDPSTGEPFQKTFPLPVTIGRSRKNDLVLNSDRISRHHAVIEKREEQFLLRDLESSNGTQVNQERITEHALVDGDLLQVGPFIIEVDVPPFGLPAEPSGELVFSWTDPNSGEAIHHAFTLPLSIGRGQENDLVLPGERVSRKHAVVSWKGDDIVIEDQGATNGVIVNGARHE
jgi:pSer/pThr/pTyr-binding forkhead associated (FHA) protein